MYHVAWRIFLPSALLRKRLTIESLHDPLLFISLIPFRAHFKTHVNANKTQCLLPYSEKISRLDKKSSKPNFAVCFFIYFPRYSRWSRSRQKDAWLGLKLSSHEKLFQLPSTPVIVTECWETETKYGDASNCLESLSCLLYCVSRLRFRRGRWRLRSRKKEILWRNTFKWKATKTITLLYFEKFIIYFLYILRKVKYQLSGLSDHH